jgi:4-hydroxybenzoate polyprenyltransferase
MVRLILKLAGVFAVFLLALFALGGLGGEPELIIWLVLLVAALVLTVRSHQRGVRPGSEPTDRPVSAEDEPGRE